MRRFLVVLAALLLTPWTNRDKRFVWTVAEVEFYAIVVGLATCLGVIAATLPLLKHITGPETARSE